MQLIVPRLLPLLLIACATSVPHASAQSTGSAKPVQGRAIGDKPESRIEATQTIDAALAAAIIGSISRQFGERQVEVKLDRVESEPLNLIDLTVKGDGRLRIGDDEEWLPMRFSAMYDSLEATAVQPRMVVGDEGEGEDVAIGSSLGVALGQQASARLRQEFAQQPAALRLDRIRQLPAGRRFARLEGSGTVDFAEQGTSVASIQALYDRARGEWLQVAYELGAATTNTGSDPVAGKPD